MDRDGDSIALIDVLTDPDTAADLQKQGPVHRATLPNGMPVWLVVGYDEVTATLNDNNLSTAAMLEAGGLDGGTLSPDMRDALLRSLTNSDPPDHTRLRRVAHQRQAPSASPRCGTGDNERSSHLPMRRPTSVLRLRSPRSPLRS